MLDRPRAPGDELPEGAIAALPAGITPNRLIPASGAAPGRSRLLRDTPGSRIWLVPDRKTDRQVYVVEERGGTFGAQSAYPSPEGSILQLGPSLPPGSPGGQGQPYPLRWLVGDGYDAATVDGTPFPIESNLLAVDGIDSPTYLTVRFHGPGMADITNFAVTGPNNWGSFAPIPTNRVPAGLGRIARDAVASIGRPTSASLVATSRRAAERLINGIDKGSERERVWIVHVEVDFETITNGGPPTGGGRVRFHDVYLMVASDLTVLVTRQGADTLPIETLGRVRPLALP